MTRKDAQLGQIVVRTVNEPHPIIGTKLGEKVRIAEFFSDTAFLDEGVNPHVFKNYEPASIPTSETDPAKHGGCCLPYTEKQIKEKHAESLARIAPKVEGRKDDSGKLDWSLLPLEPIENIIRVLMKGAEKYAPDNWKFVPDAARRYYNAALRHIVAFQKGERIDPEWNLPHLAHAACCLLFLAWIDEKDHALPPVDNYLA